MPADKNMPANKTFPSLQGCRIALTVAPDDPHSPADDLRMREAALFFYPVAQMLPPDSYDALDQALQDLQRGNATSLLLTTPYAVEAVAERMAHLKLAHDALSQAKIELYGAKTRITAQALFPSWGATLALEGSHDEAMAALQLGDADVVVVPVAQRMRSDWAAAIQTTGAQAQLVPAYRLLLGRGGDDLPGMLWGGLVDAIVFLTEDSVRHFVIRLKAEGGTLDMLGDVVVASMDAQTVAAAAAYGLHTRIMPPKPDYVLLAETLAHYFSAEPAQA